MTTRANWFEDFFHGVANDLWRQCANPEQTRAEADFLEKTLGRKARVLDVPCGYGRHSLELARRGCRVTGLDISAEFIAEAAAAAKSAGVEAEFLAGDMRGLRWQAEFDGAICMGNSFGYLEFSDMVAFVAGVARAAESILPTLRDREWYQIGDILFAEEHRYLADVSCLETEATFVRDGKTEVRKWWHWIYSVGEIRRLLEQAGLVTRGLYGSHDSRPFRLGSPLLLLVAEKSAPATPESGNPQS